MKKLTDFERDRIDEIVDYLHKEFPNIPKNTLKIIYTYQFKDLIVQMKERNNVSLVHIGKFIYNPIKEQKIRERHAKSGKGDKLALQRTGREWTIQVHQEEHTDQEGYRD